jgi:formylglycine-generating enzyme required for sulfatase activity
MRAQETAAASGDCLPSYEEPAAAGMVWIAGGSFRMGPDLHYPEAAPAHRVRVDGFWIDRTPVTNREFRRFVKATGYVTVAEIPDPKDYPGALPHMLRAGSLVFSPPKAPVDPRRLVAMVAVQVRRRLAPALWPAQLDQGPRRAPGRPYRLPGRPGLRDLGGQSAAALSRSP